MEESRKKCRVIDAYLKYQNQVLQEKKKQYNKQNGPETEIPSRAMTLLNEQTMIDMINEKKNHFKKKSKHKNLATSNANKEFKIKQNKIRELLKRRHNFKPEFCIMPFAKQIIKTDSDVSLNKIENILGSKKTLYESNVSKMNLRRNSHFIAKNIKNIKHFPKILNKPRPSK
jgi:hypothetical protein